MDTQQLLMDRVNEKMRIAEALDDFVVEMKDRLFQKVDEGYSGWDIGDWSLMSRLYAEVVGVYYSPSDPASSRRKMLDIAAFAFMAHHQLLNKGQP